MSKIIREDFNGVEWYQDYNCSKKCLTPILLSLVSFDAELACENDTEEECNYHSLLIYNTIYPKPCSIIQYNGKIDFWALNEENLDNASFIFYLRYAPPLTTTVFEEYVIYDIFGMIGSVGGTLGIFIGFSCSSVLNLIMDILKKFQFDHFKIIYNKIKHIK